MLGDDGPDCSGPIAWACALRDPIPHMDLVRFISEDPAVGALAGAALRDRRAAARGSTGSSSSFVAAAIARITGRSVILVTAHVDDADEAADELTSAGIAAWRFPALETLPGESNVSLDLVAERLAVARRVIGSAASPSAAVIIAPIQALMQAVPKPEAMEQFVRVVGLGQEIAGGPAAWSAGWMPPATAAPTRWRNRATTRHAAAFSMCFRLATRPHLRAPAVPRDPRAAQDGSTRQNLPQSLGGTPVRLDFFGDQIEKISEIDVESLAADRALGSVQLVAAKSNSCSKRPARAICLSCSPPARSRSSRRCWS